MTDKIKLIDKYSNLHKVNTLGVCPYCNYKLKEKDVLVLENGDFETLYSCIKCNKKFKILTRIGDLPYVISFKEIK